MSLIRASIRRPVAVSMVFIAIACLGAISLKRLPIDLLPNLSFPRIVIYTTYPDVSPMEVERVITSSIEQRLTRLPGKERVESTTREGVSLIVIRFKWGTDMDMAMLNVREAVDNARASLPPSATLNILRSDPTADPIMSLSVSGYRDLRGLKELSESIIKRRLEQLDGVAQAEVTGGLTRELHVEVDPHALTTFGITLEQVRTALDQANVNAPGGRIRRGLYSHSLRILGEFRDVRELGEVTIRKGSAAGLPPPTGAGAPPTVGQTVYLQDVATISDGFRDRESIARYNGRDAVGVLIFKEADANTVLVSRTVRDALEQLRSEYPDLTLDIATDQAGFISAALSNVQQQIVVGAALAFVVLLLFLRDIRYPIAIALAIPISVLAAFILLDVTGVTLNIMSLGGLALGVGMLVDNSIVVTENIFRHRQMGRSAFDAAAEGVSEVRNAVIASTLTTIAVFGPIVYIEGVAGALFGALSFAVAFSLGMSIVVALVLLPTMAARWTADFEPEYATIAQRAVVGVWGRFAAAVTLLLRPFLNLFDRFFEAYRAFYERMLSAALDHRGLVLTTSFALLAFSGYIALNLKRSVLPEVDQGSFRVQVNLPRGTPIERTSEVAALIEEALVADTANIEAVFARIGRQLLITGLSEEETGTNTATLDVRTRDGRPSDAAVANLRAVLNRVPPNTVSIHTGEATALGRLLGGAESDLSVRVSADDMGRALEYAALLEGELTQLTSINNVGIGNGLGQPEVQIVWDRERAAERGVSLRAASDVVNSYMRGVYASNSYIDFDRKIPIAIRLPSNARDSLSTLNDIAVNGTPIREFMDLRESFGASEIRRVDQKSVISIGADLAERDLASALADINAVIRSVPPPSGISVQVAGENEEMQKSIRALVFAMALAILLVYLIMAAEFESFIHPITVLLSVPMGAIGAILALWVTGAGLNTISLIGIVVLIGVVDNDAIVKVAFINQMRARGMNLRDAIKAAGHHRLRPILITTLTTLLGVLPMVVGIGAGARLQQPLAIAIFGGLASATILTLIVLPVMYEMFEEIRQKMRLAVGMSREQERFDLTSDREK